MWGPSACGKSMVVKKAIEDSEIKHVAFVSGREVICGVRQFLATIVKQLFNEFGNFYFASQRYSTLVPVVELRQ